MFDRAGRASGSGADRTHRARAGRSPREARAGRVTQIRHAELGIEALVLRDAADWASEHGVDLDDPFAVGPAGGVGKYVGSDGTPWVDEHVAKEYGVLRGTSTYEATDLIIDALDLRHRFPRLWRAVKRLQVRVRFARKISKACRDLSREAAAVVDAELARKAAWGLPWARLEKILTAAIMNADPDLHQAKLAAARFDRRVWLSESEDGLRTMVIKADAGDQLLLYALIDRIADILLLDGDTDPVDQRRSKAAGWLARPEDLVVLLYSHTTGTPQPAPEPEPAPAESPEAASEGAEDCPAGQDSDAPADDPGCDEVNPDDGNPGPGSVDEAAERDDRSDDSGSTPDQSSTADDAGEAGAAGAHDKWGADDTGTNASVDEPSPGHEEHTQPAGPGDKSQPDEAEPGDGTGIPHPAEHWPGVPEPPADWPDHDWDRDPPPEEPGAADRLPPPPSRWTNSEHRPRPEPYPPAWCYEPPEDPDPSPPDNSDPTGARLGCDLPRLVDFLTAKGLKPAPPRVILHVHLTDQTLLTGHGVVRSDDCGPMLLAQLLDLLGRHHCSVSLRPVLDPANTAAVDAYEIPETLRHAVRTRHPASVFPYSSRTGKHLELDHTIPHTHSPDPPGQTRIGNLGPLAHPEHQAKTDGVWHVEQPHPGVYLWRSPHRHYFLVTNHGTQTLGPMPAPRPAQPARLGRIHVDRPRRHRR